MDLQRYPYFASNNFCDYYFYSSGPNGYIKKGIRFSKMNDEPIIYNLAFGDIPDGSDQINDVAISNNNDKNMVLATVANTVLDFTDNYIDSYVFATGSTPSRTRLYQIGIASLWEEVRKEFDVFGFNGGSWHPFEKNVNYNAFLVKRK